MSALHFWSATALSLVLAAAPLDAMAAKRPAPPDPQADPVLMAAGFLDHHQDLKYRLLGMQAYDSKRFDDALRYFHRASFFADKPSQGMVAEMYWDGVGVGQDRALAYAWMDLAAERGYLGFAGLREKYWAALDEVERARAIEQGQAVYARFGDAAAKPRHAADLRRGKNESTGSRTGFNRGVSIEVPGPGGTQSIPASKFYDQRYWKPEDYWAWQDGIWARPRIGKVSVGGPELVPHAARPSRIPVSAPDTDAPEPSVPDPTSP